VKVTFEFAHVISIGPFKWSTKLNIEKPLNIYLRTNVREYNGMDKILKAGKPNITTTKIM
jgi:hypothetical protein